MICLIIGSLIVYLLVSKDASGEDYGVSYNGISLSIENAPKLKYVFSDKDNDPHIKFNSNAACLTCHLKGAEISNRIKSPIINHEILNNNCNLCHNNN